MYDKGYLMIKVAPATWKITGMTSTEGLKQILDGIRAVRQST